MNSLLYIFISIGKKQNNETGMSDRASTVTNNQAQSNLGGSSKYEETAEFKFRASI